MNRKLIFKFVLLNAGAVIASIILGSIIISRVAGYLFNRNVEDYLFLIALFAGLPLSFYAGKKAASNKIAHVAAVYLLTQVMVGLTIFLIFLLFYLFFKIYCAYNPCNIIPF